jgi:hypothetical protein
MPMKAAYKQHCLKKESLLINDLSMLPDNVTSIMN